MNSSRIIGITGGIAMGKTTVSNYLANTHHFPILDADLYAREAVAPGSPILSKIVDRYGSQLLRLDGSLNRARLATIIFSDSDERRWLENLIHPQVRQAMQQGRDRLAAQHDTIVLVIPLLFEANMSDLVSEIWVIACPEPQQIQRLMQREKLSFEQAQARISSQMKIEEKRDRADVVLDNSTTLERLVQQIEAALAHPGKLAKFSDRPLD